MSRTIRVVAVAWVGTVTLVTTGCMRTRALWVAPYELGAEMVVRPAPKSAVYKVNWASQRKGRSLGIEQSQRIVRAGEPLGFATDFDGTVVALAGKYELPLDGLHPDARYCVWTCEFEEPTEFARAMNGIGGFAIDVTGQFAVSLIENGFESALDSAADELLNKDDHCDDEDDNDERRHDEDDKPQDRGDRYHRKGERDEDRIRIKRD